jgi:outer membrane protein OmpA-like peptidoglycan-associated protein
MPLPKFVPAFLLVSLLCTAPLAVAHAQEELTAEEIQKLLKPKKLTRSLSATASDKSAKELEGILSRSIGVVERKKIVELTEKAELPRLDFSISFGFDSAEIDQESYRTLDTIAGALNSPDLQNSRFLINGHTDAKGDDDYNQELSQRRANAVVQYLVAQHDIEPKRLKAIGFGETALKDLSDGEAAVNRRVEIVNRP